MAVLNTIISTINLYQDFPWAYILNVGMNGIELYALRLVLLVLIIKVVLFPLDLYQKYKMRQNQLITKRLKPQMEKLQKAYANDPQVLQQKQAQLNKKEGMSYMASCIPMIVTMVIFIWFWQTLSTTAQYKQFDSYMQIYDVYTEAYQDNLGDYYDADSDNLKVTYADSFRDAYSDGFINNYDGTNLDSALSDAYSVAVAAASSSADAGEIYYDLYISTYKRYFEQGIRQYIGSKTTEQTIALAEEAGISNAVSDVSVYCGTIAQNDVHDFYFGINEYEGKGYERDSFLWIKDIWCPDVPWNAAVKTSQSDFESGIGSYATDPSLSGLDETTLDRAVSSYSEIMSLVIADDQINCNGYLILPLIAVLLNVLSQLITKKQQESSGQTMSNDSQMGCMNNSMLFIFPIMIGGFALTYCAAFTLYMLTNTSISLIFNLITSLATKKMIPSDLIKTDSGDIIEKYGRPDFSNKK